MSSINLTYLPSRLGCGFSSPRRRETRFIVRALNQADSFASSCQRLKKKTAIYRARNRLLVVYASNSNPPSEDSRKPISSEDDDDNQGPPFLTILAGFFVFVLFLWLTGSILTWILGLVANLLQLK